MKRKPNADERRRDLCDAAIEILAEDGARGLTHRKVEQRAGLPAGTTSSYFRTREALLHGAAARVAELDIADFDAVNEGLRTSGADTPASLSALAETVMRSATGSDFNRARARYELALQAHRDPVLRQAFQQATAGFVALSEQAVLQLQPTRTPNLALVKEQAYAVTTYVNGVLIRQVIGDHNVESAEDLTRQLHAVIAGIAAARHG
jgi:DNA-binding transcriptional regulator YbjK